MSVESGGHYSVVLLEFYWKGRTTLVLIPFQNWLLVSFFGVYYIAESYVTYYLMFTYKQTILRFLHFIEHLKKKSCVVTFINFLCVCIIFVGFF